MPKVLLKDVATRIKDKVDKDSTNLEYYIGGEHFDYAEVCITKRGVIQGSTIGPAFHMHFMPGDVLLMSRNPHLRKAGVVDFEGICSDVSYVCRTKDESVLMQRYLPFIFQTDHFWEFAERNKKGSTNFFLNWSDFEKYEFDLPRIEEQRKLTELLWAAQDTKMAYQELLRQSDELVKSQFIELFGEPLNPMRSILLGEAATLARGRFSPRPRNDPRFYNGAYPFIQTGDIANSNHRLSEYKQTLNDEGIKVSRKFEKGTIVIAIVGATIGATAILQEDMYAPDSVIGICANSNINNIFLEYLLRFWQPELLRTAPSVARANINLDILSKIPILDVSLQEQQRFAEVIEQSDKSKFELKQSIANITALMKSLMQQDFSN